MSRSVCVADSPPLATLGWANPATTRAAVAAAGGPVGSRASYLLNVRSWVQDLLLEKLARGPRWPGLSISPLALAFLQTGLSPGKPHSSRLCPP